MDNEKKSFLKREKKKSIGALWPIMKFLAPYKKDSLLALVSITFSAVMVLLLGVVLKEIVDISIIKKDMPLFQKSLAMVFGVVLLLAIASYARYYLVSWIGERVVADIRKVVFQHVLGLSPSYFETTSTGDVLSRITTDTTLLQTLLSTNIPIAMRNFLITLIAGAMLMITSPKLTSLVIIIVPIILIFIFIFGSKVRKFSKATQESIAHMNSYVEETLNAVRTVQAFNHESIDESHFDTHQKVFLKYGLKRIQARAMLSTLVIFLVFSAITIVVWIGGDQVNKGEISPGQLSAFVYYAIVLAGGINSFIEVISDIQRALGAADRIRDLLATKSITKDPRVPQPLPEPIMGGVVFDNVHFRYPTLTENSALLDFSFVVQPGQKIALVGPSGCGKTTVFQLLLRFYDPTHGAIRFDGVDLKDLSLHDLRRCIGFVPQEPVVFTGNAYDNIRYGRPSASDEEIHAAADIALVSEFVDKLPNGFNTPLGEKGIALSGGQKQRIAIARAILRNPALLLLDEATSALDVQSERLVQKALNRVMVGRTTIMIAHRLSTILKADLIIVIDQGKIVSVGKHDDLMKEQGLYSRLATLQFSND
jgi:ATP-binding cassette subfamily B protein